MPLLKRQGMRTSIFKLVARSECNDPCVSETALTKSDVYTNIIHPSVENIMT
jgi:hypothetical protein